MTKRKPTEEEELFRDLQQVARDAITEVYPAAAARVYFDITRWRLSKLNPDKYGDKITPKVNDITIKIDKV
jgi:hypothetical protein